MASLGTRQVDESSDVDGARHRASLAAASQREGADSVAEVFKALSSPIRVRLLWMLEVGETCVCDLADELEVTQPTVSFHLKVLANAGLVHGQRRGTWVWYSLISERLDEVAGLLPSSSAGGASA